jgi:hypothetical protein
MDMSMGKVIRVVGGIYWMLGFPIALRDRNPIYGLNNSQPGLLLLIWRRWGHARVEAIADNLP